MAPPVRVLLVDDQRLVRAGFRVILDAAPDIEVIGEAGNGLEAVALTAGLTPDVVLMDVQMPVMDGLTATREIAASGSRASIVVLTTFDADEYVFAAIRAGATGFLLKDAQEQQLIDAVRVAARGEAMLAPTVTRRLLAAFAGTAPDTRVPAPTDVLACLTDRERDVVREVAHGRSNAEIADALVLSPHTVKSHVARSLMKLELRDRTQLAVLAYEAGLVRPGEVPASQFTLQSDARAAVET